MLVPIEAQQRRLVDHHHSDVWFPYLSAFRLCDCVSYYEPKEETLHHPWLLHHLRSALGSRVEMGKLRLLPLLWKQQLEKVQQVVENLHLRRFLNIWGLSWHHHACSSWHYGWTIEAQCFYHGNRGCRRSSRCFSESLNCNEGGAGLHKFCSSFGLVRAYFMLDKFVTEFFDLIFPFILIKSFVTG